MTIFTRPLTTTMDKLNNLRSLQTLETELEQARQALTDAALKDGLSTPFTDGGEIRTEFAEGTLADNFRNAEALFDEAEGDRQALVKTATIAAGTVAGAAVGGLALREAHRRGWLSGALRGINRRVVPKAVAKRHGTIAGTAARLTMEGKVTTIIDANSAEWYGSVRLTADGFVMRPLEGADKGKEFSFGFEAVDQIDTITNYQDTGRADVARLYLSEALIDEEEADV